MTRRTTAVAAALSLLPLGQPLLLGSSTALATGAMLLSTQAAHAQSAQVFANRGYAKFQNGDYQGALADFNKAIEINPQDAFAYNNRGIAKKEAGDFQGAIADFNKALAINPQDAYIYFDNRAGAKIELGDYQGAISDTSKTIEIDPKYKNAYERRGIAKQSLGDDRGACADYKKAVSLGDQSTAQWLNSKGGAWCRNMR